VWFNTELIAVNQDPNAGQGVGIVRIGTPDCAPNTGGPTLPLPCQLWHRTNSTGSHFAVLFNPNDPDGGPTGGPYVDLSLNLTQVGFPAGAIVAARDMWAHQSAGTWSDGVFTAANVGPHEARAITLWLA
jgi:hypothetical protein